MIKRRKEGKIVNKIIEHFKDKDTKAKFGQQSVLAHYLNHLNTMEVDKDPEDVFKKSLNLKKDVDSTWVESSLTFSMDFFIEINEMKHIVPMYATIDLCNYDIYRNFDTIVVKIGSIDKRKLTEQDNESILYKAEDLYYDFMYESVDGWTAGFKLKNGHISINPWGEIYISLNDTKDADESILCVDSNGYIQEDVGFDFNPKKDDNLWELQYALLFNEHDIDFSKYHLRYIKDTFFLYDEENDKSIDLQENYIIDEVIQMFGKYPLHGMMDPFYDENNDVGYFLDGYDIMLIKDRKIADRLHIEDESIPEEFRQKCYEYIDENVRRYHGSLFSYSSHDGWTYYN